MKWKIQNVSFDIPEFLQADLALELLLRGVGEFVDVEAAVGLEGLRALVALEGTFLAVRGQVVLQAALR